MARTIIDRFAGRLNLGRRLLICAACIAAVTGAPGFCTPRPQAIAQPAQKIEPAAAPVIAPVFEVASIRENKSVGGRSHIVSSPHDGHFTTINVSGLRLFQFAFDIPLTRIVDAPAWLKSEKFDIEAKADGLDDQLSKLSSDEGKLQKRKMLQALLVERFQLKTHLETRELPIYALVVAKGGPKLKETEAGTMINGGNGHTSIQSGDAIGVLAEELAEDLGRVVIDKTGIQGRYDITLNWTPDDRAAPMSSAGQAASPVSDSSWPSLFTAIQEQLGLKLESQKGPVEVLVIDHVEQPSAN